MPEHRQRQTLPRTARIRSRKAFNRAFDRRLRASDNHITLYAAHNDRGIARLGIAVGRRYGGAVRRNLAKRLVREAFRRLRHELPPGTDWIVVPRPGAEPTIDDLHRSIRRLAARLRDALRASGASGTP